MIRVRDRKKLMNALTVDPLYLQHAQSGRLTSLLSLVVCVLSFALLSLFPSVCQYCTQRGLS